MSDILMSDATFPSDENIPDATPAWERDDPFSTAPISTTKRKSSLRVFTDGEQLDNPFENSFAGHLTSQGSRMNYAGPRDFENGIAGPRDFKNGTAGPRDFEDSKLNNPFTSASSMSMTEKTRQATQARPCSRIPTDISNSAVANNNWLRRRRTNEDAGSPSSKTMIPKTQTHTTVELPERPQRERVFGRSTSYPPPSMNTNAVAYQAQQQQAPLPTIAELNSSSPLPPAHIITCPNCSHNIALPEHAQPHHPHSSPMQLSNLELRPAQRSHSRTGYPSSITHLQRSSSPLPQQRSSSPTPVAGTREADSKTYRISFSKGALSWDVLRHNWEEVEEANREAEACARMMCGEGQEVFLWGGGDGGKEFVVAERCKGGFEWEVVSRVVVYVWEGEEEG